MPDSYPDSYPLSLWFGTLYGLGWLVVARLAVEIWRLNQRGRRARESREMLSRLARWRGC